MEIHGKTFWATIRERKFLEERPSADFRSENLRIYVPVLNFYLNSANFCSAEPPADQFPGLREKKPSPKTKNIFRGRKAHGNDMENSVVKLKRVFSAWNDPPTRNIHSKSIRSIHFPA